MKALLTHPHSLPHALDGLSLVDDALRTFDRVWRSPTFGRVVHSAWTGAPEFGVESDDDGWTLSAEVPGLTPEALEVEVHRDRLTVRGRRELGAPEGYRALRRERAQMSFERSFEFGRGFDATGVSASLKDGMLHIRVPRREDEKPRAITVTAG